MLKQNQHTAPERPPRFRGPAGLLAALLLTMTTAEAGGNTTAYRCTSADGAIELSQFPCPGDTEGDEVIIEDRRTGWIPPRPQPSSGSKSSKTDRSPKTPAAQQDKAAIRRAEKCWDKRQRLDEVNWKLRRGYRPVEGIKLRRKRQAYEGYIDRFCEGN